MDKNDFLKSLNLNEFKKLDSFLENETFLKGLSEKAAQKNLQFIIYATHKKNSKFIKIYFLKGIYLRPKTSVEFEKMLKADDLILKTEFYDFNFRTQNNRLYKFLNTIEKDFLN